MPLTPPGHVRGASGTPNFYSSCIFTESAEETQLPHSEWRLAAWQLLGHGGEKNVPPAARCYPKNRFALHATPHAMGRKYDHHRALFASHTQATETQYAPHAPFCAQPLSLYRSKIKKEGLGDSFRIRPTPLSGKRDSNPRPSAWEADALPTELLPQKNFVPISSVEIKGVEPLTSCMPCRRSSQLSYTPPCNQTQSYTFSLYLQTT